MLEKEYYTRDEVVQLLTLFLDNIGLSLSSILSEEDMARLKQKVLINGQQHWITGQDVEGLLDSYMKLCLREGVVAPAPVGKIQNGSKECPKFGPYILEFNKLFKSGQEEITKVNRDRIIKNHVLPTFADISIDKITTGILQQWFLEMSETYSKETLLKIRNTMSPAFDAAIEDGYITRNPFKSKRLVLGGKEGSHHKAIPHKLMLDIRKGIPELPDRERRMAALLSCTGMRMEEVLGLRWEDLDIFGKSIHIKRAVVHPRRNSPVVKSTKTKDSTRTIPLTKTLLSWLAPIEKTGYILSRDGMVPLSYTEMRRSFDKIRRKFNLQEYSAHDFRDTCATEWREQGIPIDVISRLLGHSKSEVTEKRYVKYRTELFDGVRQIMEDLGTDLEQKSGDEVVTDFEVKKEVSNL